MAARLVRIAKDDYDWTDFEKHEVPILFEDNMNPMVAKFKDPRLDENAPNKWVPKAPGTMGLKEFCQKLGSLSPEEREEAFTLEYRDITTFLAKIVPCIGCRRCLDKLQVDLSELGGVRGIHPFFMTPDYGVAIQEHLLQDPRKLHQTILGYYAQCRATVERVTKVRKNNRCGLHSLENQTFQANRNSWNWEDIWDLMSADCRSECCTVEDHNLCELLKNYLAKHKFCKDCRYNLVLAFHCLTGEEDTKKHKGFNPEIYLGLDYCKHSKVLLVNPPEYVASLIERAEVEIGGGTERERHAKTLVAGQREVLTIVGLYLHERFQRVNVSLKTFHASFKILYCASVMMFNAKFMDTLEKKKGYSLSMEETCRELEGAQKVTKKKKPRKGKKIQKPPVELIVEEENGSNGEEATPSQSVGSKAVPEDQGQEDVDLGVAEDIEEDGSEGSDEIGWEIKVSKAEILRRRRETKREKAVVNRKGWKGGAKEKDGGYSTGCSRESSRSPGSYAGDTYAAPIKGHKEGCYSCKELTDRYQQRDGAKRSFQQQGRTGSTRADPPTKPKMDEAEAESVDKVAAEFAVPEDTVRWFRANMQKIQANRQMKIAQLTKKMFGNK